jgi:iron(III) transport system substrate-binding protein
MNPVQVKGARMHRRLPRRAFLKQTAALVVAGVAPRITVAQTPPASSLNAELVAAAEKEGKVVWYTSVDLPVAEKIARAFEAKYPAISVRVERNGSERLFQRLEQELGRGIHAGDLVNTSDGAHFVIWKRAGRLQPYLPAEAAQFLPKEQIDSDGTFMTWRSSLSVIAYNTKLVNAGDAPKSFADLLDPKWKGKLVKGHPGYSGTIMTATFEIARDLGWGYFEKLAQQNVLQVQSSTDPPKKLLLGERAVMADGNEYNVFQMKESGQPLEVVYALEGTPLITGPCAIFKTAPNPNAARLYQHYLFAPETQQMLSDIGGLRSFFSTLKEKPGRKPLREIKLMKDDPAAIAEQSESIKARYVQIFRV